MWSTFFGRSFSGEKDDKFVLRRIRQGQKALQVIRCRVAAVWLFLAFSTGLLVELYIARCQTSHCLALNLDQNRASWYFVFLVVQQGVLEICFVGRLMLLGLAPLADDARLTKLVLVWDAGVFIHTRVDKYLHQAAPFKDPFVQFALMSYYARGVVFVAYAGAALCQGKPQRVQALMWTAVGVYDVMNGLDKVARVVYLAVRFHLLSGCFGHIIVSAAALFIIWNPVLRQRLQSKLRSWLEGRASSRAAVTIACLIGGCAPHEAVAQAKSRFRCVVCADLSFEDVQDNTPDPNLRKLAVPAQLGHCDAFISHSWHDDAKAKWKALQGWRIDFKAKTGREPLIWFDKVCIDQNNIDLDLRCLPIFLNGCERLVMLCGATYLSRLWCITEVFAYVHMGCSIERIELVPVLRESREEEDLENIFDSFDVFDVQACKCFNQEDKERMILAIQTAFGCMENFNRVVKKISRHITLGSGGSVVASDSDLESLFGSSLSAGSSSEDSSDSDKEG